MSSVILYEEDIGGYYSGDNTKYLGVININADISGARALDKDSAERILKYLNSRGYSFIIIDCEGNK